MQQAELSTAPNQSVTVNGIEVLDSERDALHILPLAFLPLNKPGLKRARLIKNTRLDSVVEMYRGCESGSGQIFLKDVPTHFNLTRHPPDPDLAIIKKCAQLPSYDVYSLRIALRKLGIEINDVRAFQLSRQKVLELTAYMRTFTRPLIREIYGDVDLDKVGYTDILSLFRQPKNGEARRNLVSVANKLEISLSEIPAFIEEYGDVFLSLSYYRHCLDETIPAMKNLTDSIAELLRNRQVCQDPNVVTTCNMMEATINTSLTELTNRFENFDRSSDTLWTELSAERYRKVVDLIRSHHTATGAVLCGLSVKLNAWLSLFPEPDMGGPIKRVEFLMSEMRQGFDRINHFEEHSPTAASH